MSDKDLEWKLAKITKTFLGFEDHGIFTYTIHLIYANQGEKIGSSGQGFGQYFLGNSKGGSTFGTSAIIGLLQAVGVYEWGELVGKMVWAQADWGKVYRIKGLDTGKELDLEKMAQEHREMYPDQYK